MPMGQKWNMLDINQRLFILAMIDICEERRRECIKNKDFHRLQFYIGYKKAMEEMLKVFEIELPNSATRL